MDNSTLRRSIIVTHALLVFAQSSLAQRFCLFPPEVKTECPSAVYDFLETYLFEIDSLQRKGEIVETRLHDDKVFFLTGYAASAREITPEMSFEVMKSDNKFYEVSWTDSTGAIILNVAFPMQYELLLGKPKAEIEQEFQATLSNDMSYVPASFTDGLKMADDGCLMTYPMSNYYVESLNTTTYYTISESGDTIPTFTMEDKWHSAANLFQGVINDITDYGLYVEQNLYGFKKAQFMVSLRQWLAYCQTMKFTIYFAVEEERADGLQALCIAQNSDLGFNHMLSVIIPNDFVDNKKTVFKATLNAYIPTQNVKDLYQQYYEKPKKKW